MTTIPYSHTTLRALFGGMLFLLTLLFSTGASALPLLLGERSGYDLTGHIELMKDPTLKMGFSEVLKAGGLLGTVHHSAECIIP